MGSALWSAFIQTLFWNPFHPSLPVNVSETSTSNSQPVCTSSVQHQSTRCTSPLPKTWLIVPTSNVGKLVGKIRQPSPTTPTQPYPTQPYLILLNPTQPHPTFHTWLYWLGSARSIEDKRAAWLFSGTFDTEASSTNSHIPRDCCRKATQQCLLVGRCWELGCFWFIGFIELWSTAAFWLGHVQPSTSPLLLPPALPSGCAALTCRLFSIAMKAENLSIKSEDGCALGGRILSKTMVLVRAMQ